jgi:ring-1,2-phenylacetyl-CoA epoxidase subunit PaaE
VPLLPRHKAEAAAFRAQQRGRGAVHDLVVQEVVPLTHDAVMLVFDVPEALRAAYRFQPGQHVVLIRRREGEEEVRRSYSICTAPASGRLCVAIKRVEAGLFSTWATRELRAGDRLGVMTPAGAFTPRLDARSSKHYVAIAAGSGITPILSIVLGILATEPRSRVTLVYGSRARASTMFLSDLEAAVAQHAGRLRLQLVVSREPAQDGAVHGRIDWPLLSAITAQDPVDEWFMCGPDALMAHVCAALEDAGVPDERVHREHFTAGARDDAAMDALPELTSTVTVTLDGRASEHLVEARGDSVLATALRERRELPYACRDGVCGTCRAKVVEGGVVMERCSALDRRDRDAGYVLACVAHPVTERLVLNFDA